MTIAGYKKAITKLLKAYHKKWDCFGMKRTRREKRGGKNEYC